MIAHQSPARRAGPPTSPHRLQFRVDAPSVRAAFLTGSSPSDFPPEHYEREWTDRFGVQDLNATGRRGLSLI